MPAWLEVVSSADVLLGAYSEVPRDFANRRQIVEFAVKCGVAGFEPTKSNAAWTAYVDEDVPDHESKEDCIYDIVRGRDLLVIR